MISKDDLAYKSATRLVRLLELNAPAIIVRKELGMLTERLIQKYDDQDGYAERCADDAEISKSEGDVK